MSKNIWHWRRECVAKIFISSIWIKIKILLNFLSIHTRDPRNGCNYWTLTNTFNFGKMLKYMYQRNCCANTVVWNANDTVENSKRLKRKNSCLKHSQSSPELNIRDLKLEIWYLKHKVWCQKLKHCSPKLKVWPLKHKHLCVWHSIQTLKHCCSKNR